VKKVIVRKNVGSCMLMSVVVYIGCVKLTRK
jgi:hypothetical protein